jgi:CDP-diacylglycerol--glycerol-3-phosphate 3-phosphatidyltransferase
MNNAFDTILKQLVSLLPKWLTPNHLTGFRFVLIIFLVYFFVNNFFVVSFLIFLLASFTDALDGTLARQRNQLTTFGAIADPLADKLLILTIIVLFGKFIFKEVIILLIVLEILTITIGAYLFYDKKNKAKSNIWGKLKMNVQVMAIILLFFQIIFKIDSLNFLVTVLLSLSVVFLIISNVMILKNK